MSFFHFVKRCKCALFLFMSAILSGTVLGSAIAPVLQVQAADFKHNHTGVCYTQGMRPCTALHSQSTRSDSKTAHCSRCQAQTTQTVYVHWDHCFGNGQDYELGGYHICNRCGANTFSWGGSSAGTHMVSGQVLSCTKGTAATGSLWFRNNTGGWTTEGVTLEAGVKILSGELSLPETPYSWDNRSSWTAETTRQVTENGTYAVYARSSDGTVVGESVRVTNIDRTGPGLSGVDRSASGWTNEDVTLTFHAQDLQPDGSSGCGLAEQAYSFDRGMTFSEENSLTVSGNGSYDVFMMDQLGNVGQAQVEVNNIDKVSPIISGILALQEGWQEESVTMQIRAADAEGGSGLHAESFSLDGETWQEQPEFVLYENGNYQAYVRDALGNTTVQEFTVGQVDVTPPVIEELQVMPDQIWEDKVLVTILAKDLQPDGSEGSGLHEEAYSLDGGETWQVENTFFTEKGKVYDIRVRDALYRESGERVVERKDFPYPPPKQEASMDNGGDSSGGEKKTEPEEKMPEEEILDEEQQEKVIEEQPASDQDKFISGRERNRFGTNGEWKRKTDHDTKPSETGQQTETVEMAEPGTEGAETSVKLLKEPWYTTTVGKIVIISTGTLTAIGVAFGIFFLLLFSVPVYCVEEKNVLRRLGRVLLHHMKEGYSVYLPDYMLRKAVTPRYRMKVSSILLKRVENTRLLVESNEKNLEVLMQETIDFTL